MADETSGVPGKRLLPQLAAGCLIFAAVMGFGTFYLAQLMTPALRKQNAEYLRTHRLPGGGQVPPAAPATTR